MLLKWIKLQLDMFDNPKLKIINAMKERDTIIYIWMRLLLIAGQTNDNGRIYLSRKIPYTIENLSIIFERSKDEMSLGLKTLDELKMININEHGIIKIKNWKKYQSVDSNVEQSRKRMKKMRERKKAEKARVLKAKEEEKCYVTVTDKNKNKEKEEELEKKETKKSSAEDKKLEKANKAAIKLLNHYEKVTGKTGVLKFESLSLAISIHGEKYVSLAIERAIESGRMTMNYVNGILKNWAQDGYKVEGGSFVSGNRGIVKDGSKFEGIEHKESRELTAEEKTKSTKLI